eukprot:TRINITY_DN1379_c0_g1_i1.p1 TRINITY_DN1379_c0_g1~~TRINITY_DN1379_c0_g1_i1.p1  ORF type:complete len:224 (+),score=37.47 TRINITY_DN1379_c0_g1_i1:38-709(+)
MEFIPDARNSDLPDWLTSEHDMGTSIMAVQFKDGVVMGADTRTSTGQYISNRASDKITPLHDRIFVCRSGSAADTQAIAGYVSFYLDLHANEIGELPLVRTSAALVQQLSYNNKAHLLAAMIIAGWDPHNGGEVWEVTLGGSRVKLPWTISGSGSTYIYGFCDSTYKPDMTKEECLQFVQKALTLAMDRDGSSGGFIRTVVISKSGVEYDTLIGNKHHKFSEV